jgi:hypothetical protein
LIGKSIRDEEELLPEVKNSVSSISITELRDVFRSRMKRLKEVIETHGEYVSERTISHLFVPFQISCFIDSLILYWTPGNEVVDNIKAE